MHKLILLSAAAVMAVAGAAPAFAQGPRQGGQGQYGQGGGQAPAAQAPAAQSGPPSGSYTQSCRNIQASGGQLSADCRNIHSQYVRSTLAYGACRGDISSNQNGMLGCNGAASTGGQVVDNGNDRNGQNRGNSTGAAAAGVIAGALLGGALAGNNNNAAPPPAYGAPPPPAYGAAPPPPPTYGDPRYGDPRYDSRYAQGGWGYGRRPGEWVPIRERADWLDQRIDRALRDGRLGRDDARDLRRQVNVLEDTEARYMRDGRLDARERADLDRRFDDLSARVRYEASTPDRDRSDRDDRGYDRR